MEKYGDTTYQTVKGVSDITQDSPLLQDESKFNLFFNLVQKESIKVMNDTKGYVDLKFVWYTYDTVKKL